MALKLGSPYHRAIRDVILGMRGYPNLAYLDEVVRFIKWGQTYGWGVLKCISCKNPMWGRKNRKRNICSACRIVACEAGVNLRSKGAI